MTVPAPGPYDWRRIGRAGSHGLYNIFLTDKDGRNIAGVWGKPDEKEATADLLAAAPDLLDALEQLMLWAKVEADETSVRLCQKARAAVSKARGENRS